MALNIDAFTRINRLSPIEQLITAVNIKAAETDREWDSLTAHLITNKAEFGKKEENQLRIVPNKQYQKAKQINLRYRKIPLTHLIYRSEPTPIYFSAQMDLKECVWQFNQLFNAALTPYDEGLAVRVLWKDAQTPYDRLEFSITNDTHLLYHRSSIVVKAQDASVTLREVAGGSTLLLTKEDIDFAINLYSKKTENRKAEALSLNPVDALGMAIGLREYAKNSRRDGLTDYATDNLPRFHRLSVEKGFEYGKTNPQAGIPIKEEGQGYNTTSYLTYTPPMKNYQRAEFNTVQVKYQRQHINEYAKQFFNVEQDIEEITIRTSQRLETGTARIVALCEYLGLNADFANPSKLYRRAFDITVSADKGRWVFDFVNHPLFFGKLKVVFVE